jgi:putative transposase
VKNDSGIAMMTPMDVHTGRDEEVQSKRQAVLDVAYQKHPEQFVKGAPQARGALEEVWIRAFNYLNAVL